MLKSCAQRVARQKPSAAEAPKPPGPLSTGEVSYWLGKFGMSVEEGSAEADRPPARPDKPAADDRPATWNNPFPPGYAEDVTDDD